MDQTNFGEGSAACGDPSPKNPHASHWIFRPSLKGRVGTVSHPASVVNLVERVREAGERIGVVRDGAAQRSTGDDELLGALHGFDHAYFVRAFAHPGGASA